MVQNENVYIQILSLNANLALQEEQDSLQISDARVSNTFTLDLCLMPNLQRLFLINNKIEELHISDNCINDRNPIHQLPSEYFTNLANLYLSHSNLLTLSYSLTVKSTSLQVLSMTNIPMFRNLSDNITFDLSRLSLLFLSENGMIDFPKITAPDLDSLDLSKNEIKFLTQEVFQGIPRIRYIDLSSNHIKSITRDTFATSIYIRELNLENNQIHHISESAFINQRGGFILRLGNNHLVSILPSSLPVLSRTVYLDPNPWNCDCESTSIKRWLLLSGVNLYQCMNPLYLRNMSLVSLNETDLCHDEYGDFKSTETQTSLSMPSGVNRILCSYCLKSSWALLLSSYFSLSELS
ncbi:leucine-rich repeat-containing protein 15-like [Lytechinus variegatus]|uniref:leucine-rich repeat-containing protein 15-like n=1 Tax=Lytechinus variegatus TaxID=7654 RepID=UPI001BB1AB0B|nr:leucine-rich repeat-containing protein 15-like [Lytechinus variegatus]